jgi:1,4-dihydroxy-2-naphthoate octaprenyltransferase
MRLSDFLSIVELRTKIVSVSTFSLALLSILHERGSVPPLPAAALFAAVLAVDMGTTAFNSYFDYLRGVDEKTRNRETDKVLVHRGVSPGAALLSALSLFAFAAVVGLALAFYAGWPLLALGAACFLVAFLYSGGPRPISSTPFGEVFAGAFLGSALSAVVALTLGGDAARAALRSLPGALHIAGILAVNNACDREGDRAAGRRTLAVVAGRRADALVFLLPAAGYAAAALLSAAGVLPGAFLAASPAGAALSVPVWVGMGRRGFSHATKGPSMGAVSRSFLVFTLSSAAAWLWTCLEAGRLPG